MLITTLAMTLLITLIRVHLSITGVHCRMIRDSEREREREVVGILEELLNWRLIVSHFLYHPLLKKILSSQESFFA